MRLSFSFLVVLLFIIGCKPKPAVQSTTNPISTANPERTAYSYRVDLMNLTDDRLKVYGKLPTQTDSAVNFCFPKIVPGIYGAMNFGRHVSNVKAYDRKGKMLPIRKIDENRWRISSAQQLDNISYEVDDAWEEFDANVHERYFYRSAESSFGKNAMVINNNCLFGFIQGNEDRPFSIEITKPLDWYGATSLNLQSVMSGIHHYTAKSYHELVDNPIMFSEADTANVNLGDINVTVAVYSSTKNKVAKEIAQFIKPLLKAQRAYLGGKLPVDEYTFIIYHNDAKSSPVFMADGLEHSNSTVILMYMPWDVDVIKNNVYGIASHEFFHTIMPLGLHSEEIEYYDFIEPKMSKHLWLYEGMTEYYSIHMPVKQGLHSEAEFLADLKQKYERMQGYDNSIPLTELSLSAMEKQDQYYNFYLKGTLFSLCLDLRLRELSEGEYGVQDMVNDLLREYGPNKPFQDEQLFDEIIRVTGKEELRQFFEMYVSGAEKLPYKESLKMVGYELNENTGEVTTSAEVTDEQLLLRSWWIGI